MSETSWDQSKFDAALNSYIQLSSKDIPVILNTKAFYIARKALWFTKKATKGEVRAFGKMETTKRLRSPSTGGLLIGALISKRGGKGGGLYGARMKSEIRNILAARSRSIAFLKSGWLTAIRGLDPKAEEKGAAAPMDPEVQQSGRGKGEFQAASDSSHVAVIVNSAIAKHDKKDALNKIGGPALRRAFDDEAASMEQYIARKMKARADETQSHL